MNLSTNWEDCETNLSLPIPGFGNGYQNFGSNSNESLEVVEEYIFERYSVRVIFLILYSIVFFLCFVGNLIVLLVVSLHWRMRQITKLCLANLAVADLCVGIFCVYQNLSTYLIRSWVLGEFLCKMYQFINGLSHTASILTLIVVCVERYLAILHPLTCRQIMTKTRLRVTIATVWLASGLYCSPRLVYMVTLQVPRDLEGSDMEIICTARRTMYDSRTFDMINAILLFLVPLVLMSVLYCRVGIVLWQSGGKHLQYSAPVTKVINSSDDIFTDDPGPSSTSPPKKTKEGSPGNQSYSSKNSSSSNSLKSHSRTFNFPNDLAKSGGRGGGKNYYSRASHISTSVESKRLSYSRSRTKRSEISIDTRAHGGRGGIKSRQSVIKMLMVIVTVFALCHFPYHLRKIAVYWKQDFDLGSIWNTVFLALSHLSLYVNCAINPIIYAFMCTSFRDCLKDLLFCRLKRPNHSERASSRSARFRRSVRKTNRSMDSEV